MIELVEMNVKIATMNVFQMFKKAEKNEQGKKRYHTHIHTVIGTYMHVASDS